MTTNGPNPPKIRSLDVILRVFQRKFQQIHMISVSSHCMYCFIFKTVAGIITSQFLIVGVFLQFGTNCARPALPAAGPHIDWLQFAQGILPTCKEVCESQVKERHSFFCKILVDFMENMDKAESRYHAPNFICPNCVAKPRSLEFQRKRPSFGVHTP